MLDDDFSVTNAVPNVQLLRITAHEWELDDNFSATNSVPNVRLLRVTAHEVSLFKSRESITLDFLAGDLVSVVLTYKEVSVFCQ